MTLYCLIFRVLQTHQGQLAVTTVCLHFKGTLTLENKQYFLFTEVLIISVSINRFKEFSVNCTKSLGQNQKDKTSFISKEK